MSKNEIFEVLLESIYEIVPELEGEKITIEDSLQDLGANSIDRAEIIITTLESINVSIPMIKFGEAKNIQDIVEIIDIAIDELHINS
ncbi:acyl carrier protein [Ornithinibacillus scapharcae]|uniref:acyl carrier protein n=1 Tax=Ornithinibacillus scapharcae TaxID=1147159 RepID=UPI000225B03C|nr:acyl carrier protein [Ornithinibacillus scapharcae]